MSENSKNLNNNTNSSNNISSNVSQSGCNGSTHSLNTPADTNTPPINRTIVKIKSGDYILRDEFIHNYKPFILKLVSDITGKFIETENSDEYAIALSAFNEAIDSFNAEKNSNFLNFSVLVIKRRITDYLRRNEKHNKVFPFTYFENEESQFEETYLKTALNDYDTFEMSKEIKLFEQKLKEFGTSLEDLVNNAPKHKDSKQLCIKIAKAIADNRDLFNQLEEKKSLPKSQLIKLTRVNKKTIERNRKFIIAAALVIGNGFYLLRDFVDVSGEGR